MGRFGYFAVLQALAWHAHYELHFHLFLLSVLAASEFQCQVGVNDEQAAYLFDGGG